MRLVGEQRGGSARSTDSRRGSGRGGRVMGFAGSDTGLTERNHELPGIESMRHLGCQHHPQAREFSRSPYRIQPRRAPRSSSAAPRLPPTRARPSLRPTSLFRRVTHLPIHRNPRAPAISQRPTEFFFPHRFATEKLEGDQIFLK